MKILYINERVWPDYLADSVFHGLKQLYDWCKTNKLEEIFGIKNEPKQCRGYIILGSFYHEGELNMDSTVGEVINYYDDCIDVISYKII